VTTKKLEDKIIKLDPLAERLDSVGIKGGASKISKPKKYTGSNQYKNLKI